MGFSPVGEERTTGVAQRIEVKPSIGLSHGEWQTMLTKLEKT